MTWLGRGVSAADIWMEFQQFSARMEGYYENPTFSVYRLICLPAPADGKNAGYVCAGTTALGAHQAEEEVFVQASKNYLAELL